MCLEGNQSLNITFKTWINKISTVSDFNSKDLITRKDLVHKSDREWSKDYSNPFFVTFLCNYVNG